MIELFSISFIHFTLIDAIDILIVATLFIWVYRYMRDTIAVQILIGMVIILGASFITEAGSFKSLNWILRTISDIWLLAFIILFQPEMRRLLMIITRSSLFRVFDKKKYTQALDQIVEAVRYFSENHIGAIIIFVRNQNIKMTIESGIPIQGVITRELLTSIFNTKSELHDGAVILENQIIVAARCVLPLTLQTKHEGRNLGTRHRAALGISEQTDVLALIVSEETGWISIAHEGHLYKNIPPLQIAMAIEEKLMPKG